jgi:hypothetical protein
MSKLLVVDKSVFHAFHHYDEKLCAFIESYDIVLPDSLVVECLISKNGDPSKNPAELLKDVDRSIKAGAKLGYSSLKLFQTEKQTLCPVKSVVNENNTRLFRNGTPNTETDFVKQEAEYCHKTFEPNIKSLLEIARVLHKNLCKRDKLADGLRKEKDRMRRFENWIQATDQKMKDIINHMFSEKIRAHVDKNWFTWQMTRLYFAYCLDLMFKKNMAGYCEKKDISNDFYDIEPVLYLCRANGLLTNDQKLQVPLAKAAFPEKDVFLVNTSLNTSRKVKNVLDDIDRVIPVSYRFENERRIGGE